MELEEFEDFEELDAKLYKLYLDDWEAFIKVMDDDFTMTKMFKFCHPEDPKNKFSRHYVFFPANGCTMMMVGRMRHKVDSACVKTVINSRNFKHSYMAIYNNEHVISNTDLMAKMVVDGFNVVLKDYDQEMTFEPLAREGLYKRWNEDFDLTFDINYKLTKGKHVSKMGFEDLTAQHKKAKARYEKRKESQKAKRAPKMIRIEDFIKKGYDKNQVMEMLREFYKDHSGSKAVSLPFRYFFDRKITGRIPHSVIDNQISELGGRVTRQRYDAWITCPSAKLETDKDYLEVKKVFGVITKK